jgi:hypothetical protein
LQPCNSHQQQRCVTWGGVAQRWRVGVKHLHTCMCLQATVISRQQQ